MRLALTKARPAGLLLALIFALPAHAEEEAEAVGAGTVQAEAEKAPERFWKVGGAVQYRTLIVTDEEPANTMALIYQLSGSAKVFENATAFAGISLVERFVTTVDQSGFRLGDFKAGFRYKTPVELTDDLSLGLTHQAELIAPAGYSSQTRDMILAGALTEKFSISPVEGLSIGFNPRFRYFWHEYAERAGPGAPNNTQLDIRVGGGVGYSMELGSAGTIGTSFGAGTQWYRRYDSIDDHVSETSDAGFWGQVFDYGWSLDYTPLKYVTVSAALEHGSSVLRSGIVNPIAFHRDETELAFTVSGSY